MNIRTERSGTSVRAVVEGACNIYSVRNLSDGLVPLYTNSTELTIDASRIDEMDSAAFQFFLALKKDAVQSGRKVTFIHHSPAMLRFLDLYGAAGLFHDRLAISKKDKNNYSFKYGTKITKFE